MIELYLRLAGATLLLLAPGALLARSASGAVVTSLALIFGAMLVVFATGSSLTLALWLLLAAGLAAIPVGLRRQVAAPAPDPIWLAVLGVGVLVGVLLWHVLPEPSGDALFHLARVRKLVAFDELSLEGVGEFVDGGLHPGYAFPLWHAFLALVAKLAGVDPADVVVHEAAVLAPLSFLVVYEAGVAVFRSRWLGVATLAGTIGVTALASGSGGALRLLALPATAGGRMLLVPAALALVFTYLHEPTRARLALVAGAGLVLAVVHPTYALFLLLVLAGFAVVRAVIEPSELRRLLVAGAAFTVGAAVFLAWLFPVVQDTASFTPSGEQVLSKRHGFDRYPGQFIVESESSFHLNPEVLTRAGPVPLAALCLVPLALFAVRRRWAAFVLGGTLVVLAVLLSDVLFPRFVDAVSLSQARRLAAFLPFAFALAGGAAVLARVLSFAVLPLALAAGIALEWAWPGDFGYRLEEGGPTLPVWIALVGSLAAIVLGFLLRSRLPTLERADWLPAAACVLFVVPMAVTSGWERPEPHQELSPGSEPRSTSTCSRATSCSRIPRRRTGSPRTRRCTWRCRRRRTSGTRKRTGRTSASRAGRTTCGRGASPTATTGSCSIEKRVNQVTCAPEALLGRSLHALREHAEAVAKQVEPRAGDLLDRAEAAEEARPPLAAQDAEAALLEHARHVVGVAQADVRRVLREHEVALLHSLDQVARVRRVHGERPAGTSTRLQLRAHREEDVVADVLDEVGGDGLVEARGVERKRRRVRDLERALGKELAGLRDRELLEVDPDGAAPNVER